MKTLQKLPLLGCFALHFQLGRLSLERMTAILELFDHTYSHARRACPSINRHRLSARRHVRIARLYRSKIRSLDNP